MHFVVPGGGPLKRDFGLTREVQISQLCHPDRNRSSQSDDLWSGGTWRCDVTRAARWLAQHCGFCKGWSPCSLLRDSPFAIADVVAPTFTQNVKVGQPPENLMRPVYKGCRVPRSLRRLFEPQASRSPYLVLSRTATLSRFWMGMARSAAWSWSKSPEAIPKPP
jgi:hypothetical protein